MSLDTSHQSHPALDPALNYEIKSLTTSMSVKTPQSLENNRKKNTLPIGLFDSSVGGLSIFKELLHKLPNENYTYFADTLNVPYGGRHADDIIELTLSAVKKLVELRCKLIIIACNSASAHALNIARELYPNIPIVGLVPALKPAVLSSVTKQVAVLATKATLEGQLLQGVICDVAIPNNTQVSKIYEPALVPWVEAGMPKTAKDLQLLTQLLEHLKNNDIDHLVLGCTHYPFFKPLLQSLIDKNNFNITIVDSGKAIADRVTYLLNKHNLFAEAIHEQYSKNDSKLTVYTSQDSSKFRKTVQSLLTNH